ncbi:MAG: hypothetical protein M3R34_00400 [Acidobacteriota bacterium]|nr:hypothetical protein [Acidobacteriota bacterium]
MKTTRLLVLALAGVLACAMPLRAASGPSPERAPILRRTAMTASPRAPLSAHQVTADAYSTEVPLVARMVATVPGDALILQASHPFTITLTARDPRTGSTGAGVSIPQNDIFGFFSIPTLTGNASNPEVFIKIIDGRALNNTYWVFYNGLTDLEYTLTVRENGTGRVKTYHKSAGNTECGAQDTAAFPVTGSIASPAEKFPRDAEGLNDSARVSTLRTSVDITNTTTKNGVIVEYQYAYTCVSSACPVQGRFNRTGIQTFTLQGLETRHFDDFVGSLIGASNFDAGADQGSYGTLLVTFRNLNTTQGSEGTVQARTYSRVVEADPLRGTVGFATPASLFLEAALTTLVGTARDTRGAPELAGTLSSNVGIRNSDVNGVRFPGTDRTDTVDLRFYDIATGRQVGGSIPLVGLRPGELREVTDIWTSAGISSSVHTVLVFADVRGSSNQSATIEGYVTIEDVNSRDASFYELKCADAVCGQ